MKTNILVFSTRLIGEQETIFQGIIGERQCPATIGEYFSIVNKKDLTPLTPLVQEDNRNAAEIAEDIYDLAENFNYEDTTLNGLYESIDDSESEENWKNCGEMKTHLQKLLNRRPNNDLQLALDKINLTKKPQHEPFTLDHFKKADILDKPAVNINLDKGKTIRDRITLYTHMDEGEDSDERTIVYAVWPLGVSDKDEKDKDDNHISKWVDCLTDAAVEEVKIKAGDAIQIILLLHDHDLASSTKTPFKTIYPFQKDKSLQRALAVFQHSNSFFREIIKPCDEGAKTVFEKAKKIVEDDVIFSHLKKLSDNIAKYNSEKDNINLKNVLKELGKYKIIFSEFPDGEVGPGKMGEESLLAANAEVNAQIKKLRTKEIEK